MIGDPYWVPGLYGAVFKRGYNPDECLGCCIVSKDVNPVLIVRGEIIGYSMVDLDPYCFVFLKDTMIDLGVNFGGCRSGTFFCHVYIGRGGIF